MCCGRIAIRSIVLWKKFRLFPTFRFQLGNTFVTLEHSPRRSTSASVWRKARSSDRCYLCCTPLISHHWSTAIASILICTRMTRRCTDGVNRLMSACFKPGCCIASTTSGTSWWDHVARLLRDHHWLPVTQRIEYKLCMTVHRCLYGEAPRYLADLITPSAAATARAGLRSTASGSVAVLCTTSSLGDRSFAVAASWYMEQAAVATSLSWFR